MLVAALAFPGGRADEALQRIVDECDELLLSPAILDETLDVLARKFARDPEMLAETAVFLTQLAVTVRPRLRLRVLADDADNRILECAIAGRADAVVTGDKAMLALGCFRAVRILTIGEYLARMLHQDGGGRDE